MVARKCCAMFILVPDRDVSSYVQCHTHHSVLRLSLQNILKDSCVVQSS